MSIRSSVNQDAVRRAGEALTSGESTSLVPSVASLQFTMLNALIVGTTFLSAGSADRNLVDRSYEVIKQSSLVSFGVNVIANASTGTTFFRVTFDAAPIGCNINVPPGVTGIFTVIDFPAVFLPQRHVDVAVDNDTGVGAVTATCLINLNA